MLGELAVTHAFRKPLEQWVPIALEAARKVVGGDRVNGNIEPMMINDEVLASGARYFVELARLALPVGQIE